MLNSNNRVDKENTNENNCEYNFNWDVIPEGKYKLRYSISKKFIVPLTPFETLIATKIPWGMYKASSYNPTLQIIPDESGNGRHAICGGINSVLSPIGNLSSVPLQVVKSVDKLGNIIFPNNPLPTHTLCSLSRYSDPLVMGRLLTGYGNDNKNYGCWRGSSSTIYENNTEYCFKPRPNGSLDWLSVIVSRNASIPVPNNIIIDGVACGTNLINITPSLQLCYNAYNDNSDRGAFELALTIIWDVPLTQAELVIVSTAMNTLLTTGILK
jgi:hypothetical protein